MMMLGNAGRRTAIHPPEKNLSLRKYLKGCPQKTNSLSNGYISSDGSLLITSFAAARKDWSQSSYGT
jgi:hypothetical protein